MHFLNFRNEALQPELWRIKISHKTCILVKFSLCFLCGDVAGRFPEIPDVKSGGSAAIFTQKTPRQQVMSRSSSNETFLLFSDGFITNIWCFHVVRFQLNWQQKRREMKKKKKEHRQMRRTREEEEWENRGTTSSIYKWISMKLKLLSAAPNQIIS